MKRNLLYLTILLGLTPLFVGAHGDNYLEFNPDYFRTRSLNVSTAGTVFEILLPSNEFLGGVDFWFDNAGTSGIATFELRTYSNQIITTKSVTIPHINPVAGGQRVHVDWNFQVPVIGNDKYRIKISSSIPQLQIYYADRVKFLGHNEPHISDYFNGVAEINGEEQNFSFKYALYEINETSAPIISNVGWSVISENQMQINFNSNEAVDYRIEYGPIGQGYNQGTNFFNDYEFCAEEISLCDILISVSPDTTYQYRLTVKDFWGNQSQVTGNFTSGQSQTPIPTPTPQDGAPVISNLRVAELAENSVGIAWTTNEVANSDIIIKFGGFITVTAKSDPTFELEHFIETNPDLSAGTNYTALVTSRDLDNNETTATLSFTTLSGPTPTPSPSPSPTPTAFPTPSPTTSQPPNSPLPSVSESPASSPSTTPLPTNIITSSSGGEGTIQWNPPTEGEPTDGYRIDVFDGSGNLVKTVYAPSGSSRADIPELAEGEYDVIVYENNGGVFKKIDKPAKMEIGESFTDRLLGFWWVLLPLLAGLGYMLWRNFKNKIPPSPPQVLTKVLPS